MSAGADAANSYADARVGVADGISEPTQLFSWDRARDVARQHVWGRQGLQLGNRHSNDDLAAAPDEGSEAVHIASGNNNDVEMLRSDDYSIWDERGLPTHYADGKPLAKNARKKLSKRMAAAAARQKNAEPTKSKAYIKTVVLVLRSTQQSTITTGTDAK